jgi:hypothetical protein
VLVNASLAEEHGERKSFFRSENQKASHKNSRETPTKCEMMNARVLRNVKRTGEKNKITRNTTILMRKTNGGRGGHEE